MHAADGEDALRDGFGGLQVCAGADGDKLVTADAADDVAGADSLPEPGGEFDEDHVAGGVTEGIVDALELVDVEKKHRERFLGGSRRTDVTAREQLGGVRRQAAAWNVLPTLTAQPVVNLVYLRKQLGLTDLTAARALEQLVDRGILEERSGKQRNRVWQHRGILNVLDDYAANVRRGGLR